SMLHARRQAVTPRWLATLERLQTTEVDRAFAAALTEILKVPLRTLEAQQPARAADELEDFLRSAEFDRQVRARATSLRLDVDTARQRAQRQLQTAARTAARKSRDAPGRGVWEG